MSATDHEAVVVWLPADAIHFAKTCAGESDISQVVVAGLELLAKALLAAESDAKQIASTCANR